MKHLLVAMAVTFLAPAWAAAQDCSGSECCAEMGGPVAKGQQLHATFQDACKQLMALSEQDRAKVVEAMSCGNDCPVGKRVFATQGYLTEVVTLVKTFDDAMADMTKDAPDTVAALIAKRRQVIATLHDVLSAQNCVSACLSGNSACGDASTACAEPKAVQVSTGSGCGEVSACSDASSACSEPKAVQVAAGSGCGKETNASACGDASKACTDAKAVAVAADNTGCCKDTKAVKVAADNTGCCKDTKAVKVAADNTGCCKDTKAVKVAAENTGCCKDTKAVKVAADNTGCCKDTKAVKVAADNAGCCKDTKAVKVAADNTGCCKDTKAVKVTADNTGCCKDTKAVKVAADNTGCCKDTKAVVADAGSACSSKSDGACSEFSAKIAAIDKMGAWLRDEWTKAPVELASLSDESKAKLGQGFAAAMKLNPAMKPSLMAVGYHTEALKVACALNAKLAEACKTSECCKDVPPEVHQAFADIARILEDSCKIAETCSQTLDNLSF